MIIEITAYGNKIQHNSEKPFFKRKKTSKYKVRDIFICTLISIRT